MAGSLIRQSSPLGSWVHLINAGWHVVMPLAPSQPACTRSASCRASAISSGDLGRQPPVMEEPGEPGKEPGGLAKGR